MSTITTAPQHHTTSDEQVLLDDLTVLQTAENRDMDAVAQISVDDTVTIVADIDPNQLSVIHQGGDQYTDHWTHSISGTIINEELMEVAAAKLNDELATEEGVNRRPSDISHEAEHAADTAATGIPAYGDGEVVDHAAVATADAPVGSKEFSDSQPTLQTADDSTTELPAGETEATVNDAAPLVGTSADSPETVERVDNVTIVDLVTSGEVAEIGNDVEILPVDEIASDTASDETEDDAEEIVAEAAPDADTSEPANDETNEADDPAPAQESAADELVADGTETAGQAEDDNDTSVAPPAPVDNDSDSSPDSGTDDGRDIDTVTGGDGDDRLKGGRGDDRMSGGGGEDHLKGSHGDDQLFGDGGDDRLDGGHGEDELSGGAGGDRLKGGHGNDKLSGGVGDDRLDGGHNADELRGGAGNDDLRGGHGNDIFIFGGADLEGGAWNDQVNGGHGHDTLDLTGVGHGWSAHLEDGRSIHSDASDLGSLEDPHGFSGVVEFDDGSRIEFDNVETLTW